MPTRGDVAVIADGGRRTLHVVGTASVPSGAKIVLLPQSSGSTELLLDRSTPVTWAEVRRLNEYGVAVLSRHVLTHPDTAPTPPELEQPGPIPTVSSARCSSPE